MKGVSPQVIDDSESVTYNVKNIKRRIDYEYLAPSNKLKIEHSRREILLMYNKKTSYGCVIV
jgi:hypothetical protein